jgi:hypothetical protein
VRTDFLRDADRVLQVRVTAVEVTGQYARDPWQSAAAGATKFAVANFCAASSASARICSIPRRHKMARTTAAHPSVDGS